MYVNSFLFLSSIYKLKLPGMNIKRFMSVLSAMLINCICQAQTSVSEAKDDFQPSVLNQPGQEYPQVNSQGYVRFHVKAPKADSMRVTLGLGGGGGTKLVKGADGYFAGVTEGPLDEGFH